MTQRDHLKWMEYNSAKCLHRNSYLFLQNCLGSQEKVPGTMLEQVKHEGQSPQIRMFNGSQRLLKKPMWVNSYR